MFSYLYTLGEELLGHMAALCWSFWGTAKLLFKELHYFPFAQSMKEGSRFPHPILGFFFLIFKFYFIFKLYIIVLVLPNIKMNPS